MNARDTFFLRRFQFYKFFKKVDRTLQVGSVTAINFFHPLIIYSVAQTEVLHGSWTVKVNSEEEGEKARFSILLSPSPAVSQRKLGRKVYVTRDKLEEDED